MKSSRQSSFRVGHGGFTLVELMIALAVLAIMVAIATPSFREISLNNRSSSNINNLLADLSMARSEAVKVARTASVAALGGDWNSGWEVFEDTNGNGVRDAGEELIKTAPSVNVGYEGNPANLFTLRGVSGATAGSDAVLAGWRAGGDLRGARPDPDAGRRRPFRPVPAGRRRRPLHRHPHRSLGARPGGEEPVRHRPGVQLTWQLPVFLRTRASRVTPCSRC